jgi:hypothetical protein
MMEFSSPLIPESLKERNRRTGKILGLVVLGLFLFSVVYILLAN